MQIDAWIPPELVDVIQAMILLFLVIGPVLTRVFRLRGVERQPRARPRRSPSRTRSEAIS